MSNQQAEQAFHKIAASMNDHLWELVGEWSPRYRRRNDEYGNQLIASLEQHGIDPCPMVELNHSRVVSSVAKAIEQSDTVAAAAAFVTSIAIDDWERVRWLIPLRAISNTAKLPKHSFIDDDGSCAVCGQPPKSTWDPIRAARQLTYGDCGEDWEVLNNVMMVRWFNKSISPKPDKVDIKLFNSVLKFIAHADNDITAYKLAKLVRAKFKGQEETWRLFFETLAFAGVLRTEKQPGHLQQWTDLKNRARPLGRGGARSPVCYWRRELGLNAVVFESLFPMCKLPKVLRAAG
jgi:hypothetical protein